MIGTKGWRTLLISNKNLSFHENKGVYISTLNWREKSQAEGFMGNIKPCRVLGGTSFYVLGGTLG